MGNKKYLKNLKTLQGNQNHQVRNARLKKFTKKQEYGSTNFLKKYFQEEGEEDDEGGWKLIYQSLFNPLSPKFNSMSNHIRDTKLWKDYIKRLNRKREQDTGSTQTFDNPFENKNTMTESSPHERGSFKRLKELREANLMEKFMRNL